MDLQQKLCYELLKYKIQKQRIKTFRSNPRLFVIRTIHDLTVEKRSTCSRYDSTLDVISLLPVFIYPFMTLL